MSTPRDLSTPLGRARMLFAMLSVPKLREGLGARLLGTGGAQSPDVAGPLSRLDWLGADGEVDLPALQEVTDALTLMRSSEAILEVGRLDGIPVKTEESREVSGRIARIVFERVGRERVLTEAELNAAIAMFAADVALVRRDAVDAGVLARTADGTAYRLA
ncbi:DUF2087 domain-containing protein [Brachybacterium saurashtrense]|uniref:DUF2087 domain-containing protein n=1 Tax=Brachybacterium saurashtrense TaxID=556288 RepID=A0A345YSD4_9MICO|nr:DUF2087 domain-containing protein [Brachybacterium saurashtrense]AXK46836.1 DUF2087 domain-containing protein [Brachybacterium saurashtrense]RRR22551.1 DUF2087 domain-containing protein [Brachybacterium saurashtrense]